MQTKTKLIGKIKYNIIFNTGQEMTVEGERRKRERERERERERMDCLTE